MKNIDNIILNAINAFLRILFLKNKSVIATKIIKAKKNTSPAKLKTLSPLLKTYKQLR